MSGKNSSRNSTPKSGKKRRFKLSDAVLIAIISAITTIVVAVINNNSKEPQNVIITATQQAMFTQTEPIVMALTKNLDTTSTIIPLTDAAQLVPTLIIVSQNTPTATLTHILT